MGAGRLLLRVTIGSLFVGHGAQKLLGWFEGKGLAATGETFERAGLAPGKHQAVLAGTTEATCGALLLAGYTTPAATAGLSGVMVTAIRQVHWRNGPWVTEGGFEYPLVVLAALFAVAEAGPGPLSLDAVRGRERRGLRWALAQLGAAALGSQLAVLAGRRLLERRTAASAASPESPQWRAEHETEARRAA